MKVILQLDDSSMGMHKLVTEDGQVIENVHFVDWGFKKKIFGIGTDMDIQTFSVSMKLKDIVVGKKPPLEEEQPDWNWGVDDEGNTTIHPEDMSEHA